MGSEMCIRDRGCQPYHQENPMHHQDDLSTMELAVSECNDYGLAISPSPDGYTIMDAEDSREHFTADSPDEILDWLTVQIDSDWSRFM